MKTITGHTKLTALLGSPVTHSVSPMMHNEAFRLLDLDYAYLAFNVQEHGLADAVAGLKAIGAIGFNLTMPNKNKIIELLDDLSPAVKLIGAANTVKLENGRLIGYNTDGSGFLRAAADAGYSPIGKTLTLLGSGGAATAICAQAALDGVKEIYLFSRRTSQFWSRSMQLADNINHSTSCKVSLYALEDTNTLVHCLRKSFLLVNATSVGMTPNSNQSLILDSSWLPPSLAVADVIYNPKETKLLSLAKRAGCPTFNGLYMLLYQGAEAFQIWTGHDMPISPIKELLFSKKD